MNIIKSGKLLWFFLLSSPFIHGQEVLEIKREQGEAIFLKENLLLIAQKLEISQAEAQVIQAKLWPNPTLTVDQVNLWATEKQTSDGQGIPALGNILGENRQFSFEFEQLIQTANKRKKLIALEKVSVEKSKQYFEDILRNLKIEFRNSFTDLEYLQLSKQVYQEQISSLETLTSAYENQVVQGNYSKAEYIRIKALELELKKELNSLIEQENEVQQELKNLMHVPSNIVLKIKEEGFLKPINKVEDLLLNSLFLEAQKNRPDYKLSKLQIEYADKLYAYEKSQKVPDVTFIAGYDRGGNALWDFVGFGLSIDLPFFNRNQGNIKKAKAEQSQANILFHQKELALENEIFKGVKNLQNAIDFYSEIDLDYDESLNMLIKSYTKNFRDRQISLLEYKDFLDAYLENKIIILEAQKEINEKVEELNYIIGLDVIK
ncbi:TolC family protein [Wenyingzhuangia sp. chi5]|uniref:TolC family protein n=1 Tax=Wenyingzhuangia gilva TaxID=3057677 RepID=A0ABT8VU96_9FLAO|nr:TolC family protein [Wenyingzhuangia sp. chi5]MDO3695536.1 TolC family protein [Wenyingzhuangia sp. chi5]